MTGDLTLLVLDGDGVTHELTSASALTAAEPDIEERLGEEAGAPAVEQGVVTLGTNGTLLGATRRSELPPPSVPGPSGGGYRAQLSHRGAVVAEGVVPVSECRYQTRAGTWAFTLVASGTEPLRVALDDVGLLALSPAAEAQLLPQQHDWYEPSDPAAEVKTLFHRAGPESVRAVRLDTAVRAALVEAGATLAAPLPAWVLPDGREAWPYLACLGRFTSSSGSPAVDSAVPALPPWTGLQLLDAVARDLGWIVTASYEPFPSLGLVVSVRPALGAPQAAGAITLDAVLAVGGWEEGADPGDDDPAGFAWANPLGEGSAKLVPSSTADLPYRTSVPMRPRGVLALPDWRFQRRAASGGEQEPEPEADVVVSAFSVPQVASWPEANRLTVGRDLDHELDELSVPITGGAGDGGTERLRVGLPVLTSSAPYLIASELVASGDGTLAAALHAREATAGPTAGDHSLETWTESVYRMRRPAAPLAETLTGDVVESALVVRPEVGGLDAAARGELWRLVGRTRSLSNGVAAYELERRAAVSDAPEVLQGLPGTVRELTAVGYAPAAASVGVEPSVVVSWRPPDPQGVQAVTHYEVDVKTGRNWPAAWDRADGCVYRAEVPGAEFPDVVSVRVRAAGELGPGPFVELAALIPPE